MKLDGILGQEHLKKKIYDSIEKKIFPQSKILVDRDGYGGLNFAIEIARGLLEVDKNYKGEILNHPDLYFSYPTFADKQTSPDLLDLWIDLIKKNKQGAIKESADLIYHILVSWVYLSITPEEIWNELSSRKSISGIDEKRNRGLK